MMPSVQCSGLARHAVCLPLPRAATCTRPCRKPTSDQRQRVWQAAPGPGSLQGKQQLQHPPCSVCRDQHLRLHHAHIT
jgi:hypothetical protein